VIQSLFQEFIQLYTPYQFQCSPRKMIGQDQQHHWRIGVLTEMAHLPCAMQRPVPIDITWAPTRLSCGLLRLSCLLDLVGQKYGGLLHLRRKVCCRDLGRLRALCLVEVRCRMQIFRAPIPACWFSGTIETERTYFPLNYAVSFYSRLEKGEI